ncbi:MAG: hypothetical protein NTW21_33975 [Verrucomicrobia bacterium]|nr:hypothetical protein [Verrucomicrobiota bacterium]
MKISTVKVTLLAASVLHSIACGLPSDVPDPYGIVTQPIPEKTAVCHCRLHGVTSAVAWRSLRG